jgi:hypothetical protein
LPLRASGAGSRAWGRRLPLFLEEPERIADVQSSPGCRRYGDVGSAGREPSDRERPHGADPDPQRREGSQGIGGAGLPSSPQGFRSLLSTADGVPAGAASVGPTSWGLRCRWLFAFGLVSGVHGRYLCSAGGTPGTGPPASMEVPANGPSGSGLEIRIRHHSLNPTRRRLFRLRRHPTAQRPL